MSVKRTSTFEISFLSCQRQKSKQFLHWTTNKEDHEMNRIPKKLSRKEREA